MASQWRRIGVSDSRYCKHIEANGGSQNYRSQGKPHDVEGRSKPDAKPREEPRTQEAARPQEVEKPTGRSAPPLLQGRR
jgi:hypothetical protein